MASFKGVFNFKNMNELIKVIEKEGAKAVSARELYLFLGYEESQFSRWVDKQIRLNEYAVESIDYQCIDIDVEMHNGGVRKIKDYVISVDFAKKLSMMSRTIKGNEARQYFIECEKQLNKPKTQIELIIESAQLLKAIEDKQNALEQRIEKIENRPQINAPIEHFSILGYCHNIGKQISHDEALSYGRKCSKACKEFGYVVGKISDSRYGAVNTYPLDILKEIIC